jgi:hypothetical protein
MLVILAGLTASLAWSQRGVRLRPPEGVTCPRDQLTAYTGKASGYERNANEIRIRVDTDWETVEEIRVDLKPGEDVRSHFLLRGEPYGQRNLGEIEETPGKLKADMRVTAWVCASGPQPLIDWRPPDTK